MRIRSLAVLSLLPLVAIACGGSGSTEPTAVGTQSDAIYKGTAETSSPAVMALQINLGGSMGAACTGTVIAVKGNVGYFLTAAHCAVTHDANDNPTTTPLAPSQLFVLPGTDYQSATTAYPVVEVKVHPSYKAVTSAPYDFALLRFSFTGAAPPVIPAMTAAEDTLAAGSKLDVIGYGKTDTDPNNSVRNHAQMTISYFQSNGALVIFDGAQNASGTCQGDSGGPGLSGTGASARVAAVTSFGGQSCGNFGGSGRVSKVYDSFIKPFVDGTTGTLTCDECRSSATLAGGACSSQVDACLADTACKAYVDCSNACNDGDSACLTKCQTDFPPGAVFNTIFDCICKTGCTAECASDALCKAPSCGFTAQDAMCQTCFENKCCAQMSACAADKDCTTCATSPSASQPASCATNALYQAEQSCISMSCFAECGGSKCGFGSDNATCNTCYEDKCCAELSACAMDSTCVSCVTTSTPAASCASNPLVKAARTCVNGNCATACGSGAGGSAGAGGGTGTGGKAGGSAAGSAGTSAGGTSAGGAGGSSAGGTSAGGSSAAGTSAGGSSAGGKAGATGGGTGTGTAGTTPAGSGGSDDSSSSGSCAVAAPSSAGSLAPLALLGLAAFSRGRRRRG